MTKKRQPKLPFKAKTMGSYQRSVALSRAKKNARTAAEHTSEVTVIRPDAEGNLVPVETVAPVFVKPSAKKRRTKVSKGSRSLL